MVILKAKFSFQEFLSISTNSLSLGPLDITLFTGWFEHLLRDVGLIPTRVGIFDQYMWISAYIA